MEKLSVTLKQKRESILMAGIFLLMALTIGVVAYFDGQVVSIAVALLCVLCSGVFFFRTGNEQTMDAAGIHLKTYLGENHYGWELVERVKIIRTSSKDLAHIQFFIRGRRKTVLVYYTKRTLECLRCYYGEADEIRAKEPPADI